MMLLLPLTVGTLFACGVYLVLRRSLVKLILGLSLLGTAANLLIFTMGRVVRGAPPLVTGAGVPGLVADPVPQALILTAIVIGFALQAFALVMVNRAYEAVGTEDLDNMMNTDTTAVLETHTDHKEHA